MTKVYNKLVRDKIPEIIKRQDEANSLSVGIDDIRRKETKVNVKYRILEGEELKKAAVAKLIEEAQELLGAKTDDEVIEELADLCTVLQLVINAYGGVYDDPDGLDFMHAHNLYNMIEIVADKKEREKGGFYRCVFLEEVSVVNRFDEEANDDSK
jgi:predicted house-cleaning noncanonical NTP pyrophosphatase (MazG superfamily)